MAIRYKACEWCGSQPLVEWVQMSQSSQSGFSLRCGCGAQTHWWQRLSDAELEWQQAEGVRLVHGKG